MNNNISIRQLFDMELSKCSEEDRNKLYKIISPVLRKAIIVGYDKGYMDCLKDKKKRDRLPKI